MKIEVSEIEVTTIDDFADKHGLVMEVHERALPIGHPARFYAHFKSAEIIDGCFLVSMFGNGPNKDDAIEDYARRIQLQRLVIDAMSDKRREIVVPRLSQGV